MQFIAGRWDAAGNKRSYALTKSNTADKRLRLSWSTDGATVFFHGSVSPVPDTHTWIFATLDINNGSGGFTTTFYSSPDGVTWTALTGQVSTPATSLSAQAATPLTIGQAFDSGTFTPFNGDISLVSIRDGIGAAGVLGGTEKFLFDATVDLAGVPGDRPKTFVPSEPDTLLVEVNEKVMAGGQGYVTFPGTSGNYIGVSTYPDLDITGAFTVVWKERACDLTPTRLGQQILAKTATTNNYSYSIIHGPKDSTRAHQRRGDADRGSCR